MEHEGRFNPNENESGETNTDPKNNGERARAGDPNGDAARPWAGGFYRIVCRIGVRGQSLPPSRVWLLPGEHGPPPPIRLQWNARRLKGPFPKYRKVFDSAVIWITARGGNRAENALLA
jgi:hypothetical protein